jgi:hypothetical protein
MLKKKTYSTASILLAWFFAGCGFLIGLLIVMGCLFAVGYFCVAVGGYFGTFLGIAAVLALLLA